MKNGNSPLFPPSPWATLDAPGLAELWPAVCGALVWHELLLCSLLGSLRWSSAMILADSVVKSLFHDYVVPTPQLGELCGLCLVLSFCHVQTQSSYGWGNTLPELLPSFHSKGLTGIVHVPVKSGRITVRADSSSRHLHHLSHSPSTAHILPACNMQPQQRSLGTQQSWNTPHHLLQLHPTSSSSPVGWSVRLSPEHAD